MRPRRGGGGDEMGDVKNVSDHDFTATLSSNEWVIVDFWAQWCSPCKAIGPVLESIAAERDILVAKVDIDANQGVAGQLGVRSIPALFIYRNGQLVSNKTGAMPKPKLLAWVDEVMNADDF